MFSALSQGSSVYILDKTTNPKKYSIGEIIGVSAPKFNNFGNIVDLKVKIGDSVQEFTNIPSVNNYISYDNGNIIISETKQVIQNEVESVIHNRKNILNNIDTYKQEIVEYEEILKNLSPQFAVDKERDERLLTLENRFDGFESKLDKIFNLIQK